MYVAPIPPKLATEAINAKPAAAARPVKKVPGTHQNTGKVAIKPKFAIENKITVKTGSRLKKVLIQMLAPAMKAGKAICQRRSRCLSELMPFRIKAATANKLAKPVSKPTCAVLLTPDSRSEEHTSELQSRENLVCRLLLEKKKQDSDTGDS